MKFQLIFERSQTCFSLFRYWVYFLWYSHISVKLDLYFDVFFETETLSIINLHICLCAWDSEKIWVDFMFWELNVFMIFDIWILVHLCFCGSCLTFVRLTLARFGSFLLRVNPYWPSYLRTRLYLNNFTFVTSCHFCDARVCSGVHLSEPLVALANSETVLACNFGV